MRADPPPPSLAAACRIKLKAGGQKPFHGQFIMTDTGSCEGHDARTRSRLHAFVSNTKIKDHVGELPPLALPTVALAAICVITHSCTLYCTPPLTYQLLSCID